MNTVHPEQEYLAFLAQGRFMIQRCRQSGEHFFYPRVAAPRSGSTDLEWVQPSGRGVVHATTVVRVKPPAKPYNVVLVELDEGPRLMSRVEGVPPEQVCIGIPVQARVDLGGATPALVFDPVNR